MDSLDWVPTVVNTMFWLGNLLGCLVWGYCSDRWGRRLTILWSHCVYLLGNLGTLLVQGWLLHLVTPPVRTVLSVSLLSLLRMLGKTELSTVTQVHPDCPPSVIFTVLYCTVLYCAVLYCTVLC